MSDQVLVAIDDSDPARRALEYAYEQFSDDDITVLTVVTDLEAAGIPDESLSFARDEVLASLREQAEERLDRAEQRATNHDIEITRVIETGNPAAAILEYTEAHSPDHIVIGTHGRSGISRMFLGSVAEKIIRRAPAPVIVVR